MFSKRLKAGEKSSGSDKPEEGGMGKVMRQSRLAARGGRASWPCSKEGCRRVFHLQITLDLHIVEENVEEAVNESEQLNSHKPNDEKKLSANKKGSKAGSKQKKLRTKQILECVICSARFARPFMLDDHIRRFHTREKPFQCATCKLCFPTKANLRAHSISHRTSSFECSQCKTTFKSKSRLQNHIMLVHEKKMHLKHKCPEPDCNEEFVFQSHLKFHSRVHQELVSRLKFRCTECDLRCMTSAGLRKHKKIHHNPERPANQCDFCKLIFVSEELLREHKIKMGHDKPKPYNCGYCRLGFSERWNLQRRRKEHTHLQTVEEYDKAMLLEDFHLALAEKGLELSSVLPCTSCESSYNEEEDLVHHNAILHNKPAKQTAFKCEEEGCNKVFTRKDHLSLHVNGVHKDIRNFGCGKCGVKYRKKESLNKHKGMRTRFNKNVLRRTKKPPKPMEPTSSQRITTRISKRLRNRMNRNYEEKNA